MIIKLASLTLCVLHLTAALPTQLVEREKGIRHILEVLEDADDNSSMDSNIRGARAARSSEGDYYKSDEREGNGEIGYSRKKSGGNKKGYQHFDAYHKKAGDNYEFEKQDSYGLDKEEQDGAYSQRHDTTAKRKPNKDSESVQLVELEDFDEEQEDFVPARERLQEKSTEDKDHAALIEGADDGNGGTEAVGHDPKDYILPEKYTYGKEVGAYDF